MNNQITTRYFLLTDNASQEYGGGTVDKPSPALAIRTAKTFTGNTSFAAFYPSGRRFEIGLLAGYTHSVRWRSAEQLS